MLARAGSDVTASNLDVEPCEQKRARRHLLRRLRKPPVWKSAQACAANGLSANRFQQGKSFRPLYEGLNDFPILLPNIVTKTRLDILALKSGIQRLVLSVGVNDDLHDFFLASKAARMRATDS